MPAAAFLCRFLHALTDHIGQPRDEFAVGGLAPVGADGVAEIPAQHVHVSPSPGHLNKVADCPLYPGSGGIEFCCQLGVQTEGDVIDVVPVEVTFALAIVETSPPHAFLTLSNMKYAIPFSVSTS